MITHETETVTVNEAVEIGLYDAIKRGETKFKGRYEYTKDGGVEFKQSTFVFTDKVGNLRVCKFKDDTEILKFIDYIKTYEVK